MSFTKPNTKIGSVQRKRTLKTNSDGFTLVELLVAITIFSLVVGMAMFSLRHFFVVVRQLDAPFAEETQKVSRMRDCIASTFNYVTSKRDMFNRQKTFHTFFVGEPEQMTFISGKPSSGDGMAICRLSLNNGALVLDEAPLYGEGGNYLNPSLENRKPTTTVIIPEAASLRLDYFRGEKKLTTMKDELPSLVHLVIGASGAEREYYIRIPTNFNEKALFVRGLHEPL